MDSPTLLSTMRPLGERASRTLLGATLALGTWIGASSPPLAAAELPTIVEASQVNQNTLGVVFHYEDVYHRYITDMAEAFGESDGLRVVPIIGLNHVQSVYDMLYMRGIDLGIVHSDVLEYMARVQGYTRVYQRINALAELFAEKIAVIAGEDHRSLGDLSGLKVNFGKLGKGSDVAGTLLFDTLGIEVEPTRFDKDEALEKVKSGDIAAMIYLIEGPEDAFTSLSPADEIRLVALPQDERLLAHYRVSELTSEEFPELIKGDGAVPSLEVPVIVAAYNWPASETARYEKSRRFTTALLDGLDGLREKDEALWGEFRIAEDVPGVPRLPLVDTILAERAALERRLAAQEAAEREAQLRARRQELMAELAGQLEQGSVDQEALGELERLIEQFQKTLDEGEQE